jgi:two-component system cell cycle sensor histidine kinase/response regulator CckA
MQQETNLRRVASDTQPTSTDLYDILFEQAPDGIVIADRQGRYLAANQQASALLGYTREELLSLAWRDVLPAGDLPANELAFTDLQADQMAFSERRLCHKDGRVLLVEIRARRLDDAHWLAFIRDISERKRAEQVLQERVAVEERLTKIVAVTPDIIGSFRLLPDGSSYFLYASPAIEEISGLRPDEVELDMTRFFARVHPDDLTTINEAIAESVRTLQPLRVEYRIQHPDKGELWVESHATVQQEPDGSTLWHGFIRDVTEQKEAEEELLYQANVLYNVSDAVISTDLDYMITSWNYAAAALYGWSATEVIGQPISAIISTEATSEMLDQIYLHTFQQGYWKGEVVQHRKDGTLMTILASLVLVKDSFGKPIGTVATYQDISERKRAEETRAKLEEQLRHAQKMESLGRLVGGVAHNFNNLLSVILGYCDLILDQLPPDDQLRTDLGQIRIASERAAVLTRHLLAIGRKQLLNPTVFDLSRLIDSLHKMFEQLIGEDILLKMDLQPDLWPITADHSQIEQVLMNLIINARDAMPTGGNLTITAHNVPLDNAATQMALDMPTVPYVLVTIADTGHGMDARTRSQIFEPFFTTKALGQGTGLGLATVYGIIKQSGGAIAVDSAPNIGTTFRIALPAGEQAALQPVPEPTTIPIQSGHETILLVEDEAAVRRLARDALRGMGYIVLEAQNGTEALACAQQYQGTIDILVTDVVMPQISGRLLAESLRVMRPEVKILFISGYTDDMMIRHGVIEAEIEFLAKPFSTNTLAAKVREVLDREG